jgi:hypothetical protein
VFDGFDDGRRAGLVARVRVAREPVRVCVAGGASVSEVTILARDLLYPFGYNDVE